MPSLLPGYEYDIFISYRQKDNKGDKWVTTFVNALKAELEATFKEDISIYFDENPHDGLLETHHVDKSLVGKLKCLIFIPIISQTYCDPKSFAWQNEFCAFNKLAKDSPHGRDIKLSNSNVTSRILPIKIHGLDTGDQKVLETEMGTALRAIEFIYKDRGVNRPLSPDDDSSENLNKTKYRNQVNKVANAIKEIIVGLKNFGNPDFYSSAQDSLVEETKSPHGKSIVVLPFEDMSQEKDQEYFCDGLAEELINALAKIRDIHVVARTSAFSFKGKEHDVRKIGKKLKVESLLEGSVRKAGNQIRITVQLINVADGFPLWSERYDREVSDVFAIQDEITLNIVDSLRLHLTSEERASLSRDAADPRIYACYLRAGSNVHRFTEDGIREGISVAQRGIDAYGEHPLLLAILGDAYARLVNVVTTGQDELLGQARKYAQRLAHLDPKSGRAHYINGFADLMIGDIQGAVTSLKQALAQDPQDPDTLFWLVEAYGISGHPMAARPLAAKLAEVDPLTPSHLALWGWVELTDGKFAEALRPFHEMHEHAPESPYNRWCFALVLSLNDRKTEAMALFEQIIKDSPTSFWAAFARLQRAAFIGDRALAKVSATADLVSALRIVSFYSWVVADAYCVLGEHETAMEWLEHAVERGFINFPLLNRYDPLLAPLRGDARFARLMETVRTRWEAFEV